jgi:hypothetical protein
MRRVNDQDFRVTMDFQLTGRVATVARGQQMRYDATIAGLGTGL